MTGDKGRLIYSSDAWDNGYKYDDELQACVYRDTPDARLPENVTVDIGYYGEAICTDENGDYVDPSDYGITFFDGNLEFDCFCDNFKNEFNSTKTRYIAHGTLGRWDGTYAGGTMINSFQELLNVFSGYDDVSLYDEDGDLRLYLYHHDGTDVFTIRELTDKGEAYYNNHPYDDVRRHIAETKGYTRKAHLADKVFGKMPKTSSKTKKE